MNVLTTATADRDTGVWIRFLLRELAFVRSPLFTEFHTAVEAEAAERGVWDAIADAAARPEKGTCHD